MNQHLRFEVLTMLRYKRYYNTYITLEKMTESSLWDHSINKPKFKQIHANLCCLIKKKKEDITHSCFILHNIALPLSYSDKSRLVKYLKNLKSAQIIFTLMAQFFLKNKKFYFISFCIYVVTSLAFRAAGLLARNSTGTFYLMWSWAFIANSKQIW